MFQTKVLLGLTKVSENLNIPLALRTCAARWLFLYLSTNSLASGVFISARVSEFWLLYWHRLRTSETPMRYLGGRRFQINDDATMAFREWLRKQGLSFQCDGIFKRVCKTAQSDYYLRRVCPSAWNNSAPTRRIFMKFDIWVLFFPKSVQKIQVLLTFSHRNFLIFFSTPCM
jgi:hypothetical protein